VSDCNDDAAITRGPGPGAIGSPRKRSQGRPPRHPYGDVGITRVVPSLSTSVGAERSLRHKRTRPGRTRPDASSRWEAPVRWRLEWWPHWTNSGSAGWCLQSARLARSSGFEGKSRRWDWTLTDGLAADGAFSFCMANPPGRLGTALGLSEVRVQSTNVRHCQTCTRVLSSSRFPAPVS